MRWIVTILGLAVALGVLVFHPRRPLYQQHRAIEVAADDGAILRGTLSLPRWSRRPVPGVVLVHGSGPLTREHVRGDSRCLSRLGFAVLAYDKRGVGASAGVYVRQWGDSAEVVLQRLAADAAAFLDRLVTEPDVDPSRVGFFGASQAGWIIPLAAHHARHPPRFQVILSGAAVSTGVEGYYSTLTGDGTRTPQVRDRSEVQRLIQAFRGRRGFDPVPVLAASRVPTLWLLGDLDESVPTSASVQVLDSLRAAGNESHAVRRYPSANHSLRDVATGEPLPVFEDMMSWLTELGIVLLVTEVSARVVRSGDRDHR